MEKDETQSTEEGWTLYMDSSSILTKERVEYRYTHSKEGKWGGKRFREFLSDCFIRGTSTL